MRFVTRLAIAAALGLGFAGPALAQNVKTVGGAPMFPSKNIVENAVNSKDHTTLVAAVKAAGLVDTLTMPGPFTVFAPTNAAFNKLPPGTVQNLVRPENKGTLTSVLTYHVVPGRFSAGDLMKLVRDGGGEARLKTANGQTLSVLPARSGNGLFIADAKGNTSRITIADVFQSNGVIHVVNTVVMP
jgi:uncharacterized surface protein with fasciclin (FAS1) repeats